MDLALRLLVATVICVFAATMLVARVMTSDALLGRDRFSERAHRLWRRGLIVACVALFIAMLILVLWIE